MKRRVAFVAATVGYLLFSDCAANVIYKWSPDGQFSVFLPKSGYSGTDMSRVGGQSFNGRLYLIVFGSNGITLDPQHRVVFATHGDRTIVRRHESREGAAVQRCLRVEERSVPALGV